VSLDDGITKLIGNLYEAAYDPAKWQIAMAEILRRSDSRMAVTTAIDFRQAEFIGPQVYGVETSAVDDGRREYTEGMHALDPALNWAQDHPAAGMCETAALIPRAEYDDHAFIKWSRSRFGTRHWRFFHTEPLDGFLFGMSFHAHPDNGPSASEQLPLQALLFENLERAIRLAARPPNFGADDAALIAVDAAGRPLSLSQRAEEIVRDADSLVIRDSVLVARSSHANWLLQRAIRAAADLSTGIRPGRAIRLSSAPGKSNLVAIVSHYPSSLDHLPGPVPAALVRLIELNKRSNDLGKHAHLFDLSPRETDVASALLEGHSIESMSASLEISRNTARNHLQSLFRKTGTNRQSDLIRMLERIAGQ